MRPDPDNCFRQIFRYPQRLGGKRFGRRMVVATHVVLWTLDNEAVSQNTETRVSCSAASR
jgi:hypothetical protein